MVKFISVQEALKKGSGTVSIRGWTYRERGSNNLKFIVLRDESNIIQCILKKEDFSKEWEEIDKIQVESSLEITGTLAKDPRAPTGYELKVKDFKVIGSSDKYPITKDQSYDFLLEQRHLAIRTRRLAAIFKIRSSFIQHREEFFRKKNFYRFDTPILHPTQSEGGSTVFEVKYYKDKMYLAQTWQLYAEAAISSLERIYNFGPTFRAEKSKTSRHLSEFWMAEMEAAWFDLKELTEFCKEELKYSIRKTVEERKEEFKILGQDPEKIIAMTKKNWPTMKYREALKILKEKDKMNVSFGKDLRTIEEEKITSHFDVPIVVTHYPVEAMGFYKPRDPENPDEALCFDMLAPNGTEIVGGSVRSMDVEDMKERLKAEGEDPKNYDWYFDLRKYGGVPHAGYGVGTERVIAWICGVENIKDVIAFPRTMTRYKP